MRKLVETDFPLRFADSVGVTAARCEYLAAD